MEAPTVWVTEVDYGPARRLYQTRLCGKPNAFGTELLMGLAGVVHPEGDVVDPYALFAGYRVYLEDRLIFPRKL